MPGEVVMLRRRKKTPDAGAETDRTAVQPPPSRARPTMAERGAGAVAALGTGIARLVRLAAIVLALIIGLGIAFKALGANSHNTIVSGVHDAGHALASPFNNMFKVDGAKATLAVNWGIAVVVYLAVGFAIARFVARLGAIRPLGRRRRLAQG